MSQSTVPLVHEVLPLFDILTKAFDDFIDNEGLHAAVRHAALRGMHMLNKYYGRSDESVVFRIAISMLSFFSQLVLTLFYSAPSQNEDQLLH